MTRTKFFTVSQSRLEYKEIRFFKAKLFGSSILLSAFVLLIVFVANHFSHDMLGLGYDRMSMLDAENRILKNQLKELSTRFEVVQHGIEKLADRGNELRLLVDMPKIDKETQEAAIGGFSRRRILNLSPAKRARSSPMPTVFSINSHGKSSSRKSAMPISGNGMNTTRSSFPTCRQSNPWKATIRSTGLACACILS